MDCSLFPPLEVLVRWMDILSAKDVKELVMLDVAAPSAVEFLADCLRTPSHATLALGEYIGEYVSKSIKLELVVLNKREGGEISFFTSKTH